jgi:CDP-glucose 4,6-dehydratase
LDLDESPRADGLRTSQLTRFYEGRTVLVTGSSGFKGSWLSLWLTLLGAQVCGFSLPVPDDRPSHFDLLRLTLTSRQVFGDVRDAQCVLDAVERWRPSIIFHLAAQPTVAESIKAPSHTFAVNVLGTAHVLDAAREVESVESVVCVTSDKCYMDQNWVWGYRETDALGGRDPYSASKAAAEFVIEAFRSSVLPHCGRNDMAVASARAGNVIGGGDWAHDRLIPDIIRWAYLGSPLSLRNPASTRPWQHVLEALSGYLWLGVLLSRDPGTYSTSWNFGPHYDRRVTAEELLNEMARRLDRDPQCNVKTPKALQQHETMNLRLDSHKSFHLMDWRTTWSLGEALDFTAQWYSRYYKDTGAAGTMRAETESQIRAYCGQARTAGAAWAAE